MYENYDIIQKMKKIIIYWSRRDFRLGDNPALHNAVSDCHDNKENLFLPIFILEDYMLEAKTNFQFGYPSRIFLSQAIPKFAKHFDNFLLLKGQAANIIIKLEKSLREMYPEYEIEIFVNEDIYIDFYKQIEKIKKHNINIKVFVDQLTVNKNTVSGTGTKYSVFTPFKKNVWQEFLNSETLEKVNLKNINYLSESSLEKILDKDFKTVEITQEKIFTEFSKNRKFEIMDYKTQDKHVLDVDDLISEKPDLQEWYFDEKEAAERLDFFVKNLLKNYKENRDSLENDVSENSNNKEKVPLGKTSKLSVALAWGLISARQIKQKIKEEFGESKFEQEFLNINWFDKDISVEKSSILSYLSELVWREFYKYLLFHNPNLMDEEFQEKFKFKVEWIEEKEALKRFKAWTCGETGYKIVDAAMLQLAKTGHMHNRARMIVASVLTKNLGVDWRWGQEYFRATLIDLDEASNNGGWQWGASVGADPKPIRIFNPYLQAENYDKHGEYQKKWLGDEKYFFDLPPMVEHKVAREEALKRYGLDNDKNIDNSVRDY